jgi:hypothetical protein
MGQLNADTRAQMQREAGMKYLNGGPILTDLDQLRAAMASAAFSRKPGADAGRGSAAASFRTTIAGWVEAVDSDLPILVRPSIDPEIRRSLSLVTFPVTLKPSPVGTTVRIDRGFNILTTGPLAIPVFDVSTGTWLASAQPGTWLLGFRPPSQIGNIRPTRVTLHGDVALPAHTMTLRRGQVRNGQPTMNPSGPEVARWANSFGTQPSATFDVTNADYDATGTVWFYVQIETPPPAGGVMPLWSITELGLDIEGQIQQSEDRS